MSASFEEALMQASWWMRYALDRCPDEPGIHPGVFAHLTAATVQIVAVEALSAETQPQL